MRVFRIEVKFEDGKSSLPANFKGFVALKNQEKLEDMQKKRCLIIILLCDTFMVNMTKNITGLLSLSCQATRITNYHSLCFPSLNESGDELQYTPLFDFFPFETITRHVRVTISEETTVKFDRIIAKYNKVIEDKNKLNIMLIRDGVEDYIHKV